MSDAPIAPLVVVIIFCFGVAIVCLGWPKWIQALSISSSARWPSWHLKYYPFAARTKEWMKRPSYVWYLRAVGIFFATVGSTLFFIAAVR